MLPRMLGLRRGGVLLAIAVVAGLVGAGSASATTFCVPDFHPACPNSGGNVRERDLERAMGLQGGDGRADLIVIDARTIVEDNVFEPVGYEDPNNYSPEGSDPLTIIGAGPASTVITSAGGGNIFLVNLGSNNSRAITMRDLTFRIPAAFTDNMGSAIQLDNGDTLDNVDIVSRNLGSDAIPSIAGTGNVFRNGEIRGEMGGTIVNGIGGNSGSILVEDSRITDASWALLATGGGQVTARRVFLSGVRTYGAFAGKGLVVIENSLITLDDAVGIHASSSGTDNSSVSATQVTALDPGGTNPAFELRKPSGAGSTSVTVVNSIFRGFDSGYDVQAAAGPGIGLATLHARYSNFPDSGNAGGNMQLGAGNVNVDPLLNTDLSLPPNSPAIDAGEPVPGGLATDFLNAVRPVDGNGDGSTIRDMGAYEYQPPRPRADLAPGDVIPPQTTIVRGRRGFAKALARGKAKFDFRSSEPNSTFVCKLDRRKVASCKSPKRYRGLRAGRHTFKVWATDAAGNKDLSPAKKRFRVPA